MADLNRVLVIESDAATRDRYAGWLEADGFEVETSKTHEEALVLLARSKASIGLVVANIPKSPRGHALIEQILAVRSDVPIVGLAADNRSSVAAIERGALHCLVRPVEEEPLRKILALVKRGRTQRAPSARARRVPPRPSAGSVSATDAKNKFATLLETAVTRGHVVITKHDAPNAVLVGVEEFNALAGEPSDRLSALTSAFDDMLRRMQEPGVRARMQAAFDASPEELGEAAVRAARQG